MKVFKKTVSFLLITLFIMAFSDSAIARQPRQESPAGIKLRDEWSLCKSNCTHELQSCYLESLESLGDFLLDKGTTDGDNCYDDVMELSVAERRLLLATPDIINNIQEISQACHDVMAKSRQTELADLEIMIGGCEGRWQSCNSSCRRSRPSSP